MAVMPSASDSGFDLGRALLEVARDTIVQAVNGRGPEALPLEEYHEALRTHGASFVTLHKQGELRGCIGNLNAHQPLVRDVAGNAYAAAFRDPRFPVVGAAELESLHIEISVLTPRQPLEFDSEKSLLEVIQPHVDGLVLEEGRYRGTFLPVVWQKLPDKAQFLRQLKLKAGLNADYWSPTLRVYRYRTTSYSE